MTAPTADLSLPELEQRFQAMHAASRREPPMSEATRRDLLGRLQAAVGDHRHRIADAISSDFGNRAMEETVMADVMPTLSQIVTARKHLSRWMRPEKRKTELNFLPARNRVYFQPKGVVLVISPWNYPLSLAVGPLAAALAAGNRVVVKPSEFTPAFSALLKELLERALGSDMVTVATGGAEIAGGLAALPFDHILFTGSTSVGRKVMAAAAPNLTPVTLELGGKSPAIVHSEFDVATAARRIARGKLLNAGQTCIAPDYALVPADRVDTFVANYKTAAASFYPQIASNAQYTSIITRRHYERLLALLADARAKGAAVTIVDPASELPKGEAGSSNTRKIAPTVLTGVSDAMQVMQEEIFGPLLPVVPYASLDEAIAYVNARPRPLALYYFDTRQERIAHVLGRTTSGGASVNDTLMHVAQEDLPFGGVGPSGMGSYHGREGFLTFSHAKGTFHQGRFTLSALVNPPYGARFHKIMQFALARVGAR